MKPTIKKSDSCASCFKVIPEQGVSYAINPDALCVCNTPDLKHTNTDPLDELLERHIPHPRYPEYNMGLLPDEQGYDSLQYHRNIESEADFEELKQAINNYINSRERQAVLDEYDYIERNADLESALGYFIQDRIAELNQVKGEQS
jgi:hypothetical protein